MVKVSVVIPVYDVEEYLSECLNSVINQSLKDIEIICINDGSNDGSLDILKKYSRIDDRIKVINQENKGLGATRNVGIDNAHGKYIFFLDSDDYIEVTALQQLYDICEMKKLDFIICQVKNYDEKTGTYFNTEYYDMPILAETVKDNVFNYEDVKEIISKINVVAWNKFFNLNFIKSINARFSENLIFEDNIFFWTVLFNAKRIYFYQKYLYFYRHRELSITSSGNENLMDTIEIHNQIFDTFKVNNKFEMHENFLFNKKIALILQRFDQIDIKYKEKFFKKIKDDFIIMIEEYGLNHILNFLSQRNAMVLNNACESNNYVEFSLKDNLINLIIDLSKFDSFIDEKKIIKKIMDDIKFEDELFKTKNILSFHIKIYKCVYSILINSNFENYILRKLINWCELLIKSKLSIQDKIDLFRYSKPLFDKFYQNKIKCSSDINEIIKLIYKNKFFEASQLTNRLFYKYDIDNSAISEKLKNKNIFIIFKDLDNRLHGLIKAAFDKANLFKNAGYSVTLLNIDPIKNTELIMDNFYNLGYLNKSINLFNIYDYYSKKNTFDSDIPKFDFSNLEDSVKLIHNSDDSITLQYYDDGHLVKEEIYISGYLSLKKIFTGNVLEKEYYLTCDGYNYLYKDYKNNDFILFDRIYGNYITFKNTQDFEDYFVTEMCLNSVEKPFLINDCSSKIPSIKNIDSNIAYKIGVAHNNPYFKPFCYGCDKWYMASLEEFKYEDKVVVLTESAKKDFMKEFKANNFTVIPNFIKNEDIQKSTEKYEKENKVISIFARISPDKNIADLIKAFKEVLNVHNDAILKIFGDAYIDDEIKEKKQLEHLIEILDLSKSVKFMGQVTNVYEEMSKSVATVLCSNIEGLPLVILESMINSTPVISYDTNYGPRDVIVDDENGFIVEKDNIDQLSETILKVLDNPEKAKQMGIEARQYIIDNFNEKIVLNKWENLFKELYLNDLINNKNDVF